MPRNIKTEPIDEALAAIMKGAARTEGVTQEEVAERTGIPITTVQRLFAGKSSWNVSQFWAICDAIGSPKEPAQLFNEAIGRLATKPVSEAPSKNDLAERRRQRQAEAAAMTVEQLEAQKHAATSDPELDSDEPESP